MEPEFNKVKVVLFDSGYTLNGPRTGQWFIPPRFGEVIDTARLDMRSFRFSFAMLRARWYLNRNHSVKTEEEEYRQFKEFYYRLLKKCKYPLISDKVVDILARDVVFNDDKFLFYEGVEEVLKALGEKYTLGILSDTWPSLERVYKIRGLRNYFSVFVMSSVHGISKSNGEKLFKIALEELKCKPEEVVFVDDSELNLGIARKLGMKPIKPCTYNGKKESSRFRCIKSLCELKQLLL